MKKHSDNASDGKKEKQCKKCKQEQHEENSDHVPICIHCNKKVLVTYNIQRPESTFKRKSNSVCCPVV